MIIKEEVTNNSIELKFNSAYDYFSGIGENEDINVTDFKFIDTQFGHTFENELRNEIQNVYPNIDIDFYVTEKELEGWIFDEDNEPIDISTLKDIILLIENFGIETDILLTYENGEKDTYPYDVYYTFEEAYDSNKQPIKITW